MASSSSNLQDYMQRNKDRAGSLSDIYNLPANQFSIMMILSEPKEMPYKQLCKAIEELPENKRLTQSQIDGTLYELIRMGYLTSFVENGDIVYMVQVSEGKAPEKRDEQRLFRKLDLKDLNLESLNDLKEEDTN
mgnify:CR=1 FL=1